jgi:hypothetical protein
MALLTELAVPGGGPGEEVDQVPERDRAQPGPHPHQQREQEQAAAAGPQPPGRPPGPQPPGRPPGPRGGRPGARARHRDSVALTADRAGLRGRAPPASSAGLGDGRCLSGTPRRIRERGQRFSDRPLGIGRKLGQDVGDQRAPPRRGLAHHLAPHRAGPQPACGLGPALCGGGLRRGVVGGVRQAFLVVVGAVGHLGVGPVHPPTAARAPRPPTGSGRRCCGRCRGRPSFRRTRYRRWSAVG